VPFSSCFSGSRTEYISRPIGIEDFFPNALVDQAKGSIAERPKKARRVKEFVDMPSILVQNC
jgi:hypothetical protein